MTNAAPSSDMRTQVRQAAQRAQTAAAVLGTCTRASKDAALQRMADALLANIDRIVEVNAADVRTAEANGTSAGLIDRLTLTPQRITDIAEALRHVASLVDPVGDVVRGYRLPNGLDVSQVRVPLGVVAMIYEARPNVTVDAAGLCLKSGNAVLLRGSSSAQHTNEVLIDIMRAALADTDVPADAIMLVPGVSHDSVTHLMQARGLVDVIIPRGGAGLINSVVENSQVPVIETGVGNCHVYVDASANIQSACEIVMNAKTQRPSVCNAAESLLVHADIAPEFLPKLAQAFAAAGVHVHGDERVRSFIEAAGGAFSPVTHEDWEAEYYSLDMAVGVVDSLGEAISHIRRYSTGHTEAIISDNAQAIREFTAQVDSAAIMVNASTRFTDGGEFGFGAEIGISTQKLHARGPMGLAELTSTKYIVTGDGHIRGSVSPAISACSAE